MKTLLLLVTGLSLLGCSRLPTRETSSTTELTQIFDAHMHLKESDGGLSISEYPNPSYDEFKKAGVTVAVAHAERGKPIPGKPPAGASFKLIQCAAVVEKVSVQQMEDLIKSKKCGCLKIYLGYIWKYASDPFYLPFYRLAEKYDVPVVFHTGDTYSKKGKVKYADPLTIDEVAVDFPKVRFLIAHIGNPWFASAAEVVYKNDNVYADTSGLMLGDISKETPELIGEMIIRPLHWFFLFVEKPKKILFGTDWPLVAVAPYMDAVKKAIPREHWKAVFYDNAAGFFKVR